MDKKYHLNCFIDPADRQRAASVTGISGWSLSLFVRECFREHLTVDGLSKMFPTESGGIIIRKTEAS